VKLILGTHNAHKVREVSRILAPYGIAVEAVPDSFVLPPEDGESFAHNALPKARAAANALGRRAIADDSGIEAEALGGAPGVRSARYAGEHASDEANLAKLLAEAPAGSRLRYVCALAYVDPALPASEGGERMFVGESRGRLAARPRGDRGFGYDPAFVPDEGPAQLTMAELNDSDKDSISHRGRALRAFADWYARAG
jgi:XTP/dITP diphosphohydrolase